ncbi:MAG: TIGR03915 family putative DNA repair protein [Bacteroidales bacterium]|nr:TIGR03915 family putative DNA repair protein [Bacteroidales bacterium]
MVIFVYDRSFEGLLTSLFYCYSHKRFPDSLLGVGEQLPLLCDEVVEIVTDDQQAGRVWRGLEKKLSGYALWAVAACWMSGLPQVEMLLLRYMKRIFDSHSSVELDFADPDVLEVVRIAKKVAKERERVVQFVRFQHGADDIYYACINPIYNVLPFAVNYFTNRFAFQRWIIYDTIRQFGYYYDGKSVTEVNCTTYCNGEESVGVLGEGERGEDEELFRRLWQTYFSSIAIKERLNPKLHRQHMPVRFWKYLTEKQLK